MSHPFILRGVQPRNFCDVVLAQADYLGERDLFVFLADGEKPSEILTCAALSAGAKSMAVALRELTEPGDRVLLPADTCGHFVIGLIGCMYAGVIPTPFPPLRGRAESQRLRGLIQDSKPALIAARGADIPQLTEWLIDQEIPLPILPIEAALKADTQQWRAPTSGDFSPALLQYTSGAVGRPKGVLVGHGGLLANLAAITERFGQDEHEVVVGWQPLFHDMGLIGNVLQSIFSGARTVLMPPQAMLRKPLRWLRAISRYGATISGGPDFAYRQCLSRIGSADPRLDLSRWRLAFCGGEPVRTSTMRDFTAKFSVVGFDAQALTPVYGLSESTLFVSGGDAAQLESIQEDSGREIISCGRPADKTLIQVYQPDGDVPLGSDEIGELCVSGPGLALGYWGDETDFGEDVRGRRMVRTGDLGFVRHGEVYVTGRLKDVVIRNGQNIHAEDIEHVVSAVGDQLSGNGAVFTVFWDGVARVIVVHEVARNFVKAAVEPSLLLTIRKVLQEVFGFQPDEIAFVRSGALPRTSSGKIRRSQCRTLWLENRLQVLVRRRWFENLEKTGLTSRSFFSYESIRIWLLKTLTELMLEPPPQDVPLIALGLDSVMAVELSRRVQVQFGVVWPFHQILQADDLKETARFLVEQIDPVRGFRPRRMPELPEPTLTGPQRRLWSRTRGPRSFVDHHHLVLHLAPSVNDALVKQALDTLMSRTPLLRTVFEEDGAVLISPLREPAPLGSVNARRWRESRVQEALLDAMSQPLDLSVQTVAFRRFWLGDGSRILLMTVHGMVADRTSMVLLLDRFLSLYRRFADGEKPKQPIVYRRYFGYDRTMTTSLDYWSRQLAGAETTLALAEAERVQEPGLWIRHIPAESVQTLWRLAAQLEVTPYLLVLGVWLLVLHRHSEQRDILIKTLYSHRLEPGFDGVFGNFDNLLVIRSQVEAVNIAEYFKHLWRTLLDAYAHGETPFADVAREVSGVDDIPAQFTMVQPQRAGMSSPWLWMEDHELGDLGMRLLMTPTTAPPAPLDLTCVHQGDFLQLRLGWDGHRYDRTETEMLGGSLMTLLEDLAQRLDEQAVETPAQA